MPLKEGLPYYQDVKGWFRQSLDYAAVQPELVVPWPVTSHTIFSFMGSEVVLCRAAGLSWYQVALLSLLSRKLGQGSHHCASVSVPHCEEAFVLHTRPPVNSARAPGLWCEPHLPLPDTSLQSRGSANTVWLLCVWWTSFWRMSHFSNSIEKLSLTVILAESMIIIVTLLQ